MNLFPCQLQRDEERLHPVSGTAVWPVSLGDADARLAQTEGDRAVLGIRPEDVVVALPDELDEGNSVPCTVEVVEHMGSPNIIYARVDETLIVATMETAFDARIGHPALMAFSPSKCIYSTSRGLRGCKSRQTKQLPEPIVNDGSTNAIGQDLHDEQDGLRALECVNRRDFSAKTDPVISPLGQDAEDEKGLSPARSGRQW